MRTAGALPWRDAGLTERQAATHLLDRLAFGPRPGDVEDLLARGLETWIEEQLAAELPEPGLVPRLAEISALSLTVRELPLVYPQPSMVMQLAQEVGAIDAELGRQPDEGSHEAVRERLAEFAAQRGFRPPRELVDQLRTQKLLRAVYAENQLREVLTDFWFNHFNVSLTDNHALAFVLAYERDAIRPNVLGGFRRLLGATAKHPAMLFYLDNANSTAPADAATTMQVRVERQYRDSGARGVARLPVEPRPAGQEMSRPERVEGLNENYARELLELHTLGVDGGYTQQDVVEVARAFTGWMPYPPEELLAGVIEARLERALALDVGFVVEGGFLFRADAHDAGPKMVLGRALESARGIEDGEEVLDLVASHPATARHLAGKLATRFVADDPPPALVESLTSRFRDGAGDLTEVMRALVESPEFWSRQVLQDKIKSPFELAASAARSLGAEIGEGEGLAEWVERMGQPLYAYQAPTGFPDRENFWVNAGSLLNRMNFGLVLASGRVEGVRADLLALNGGLEPESRETALATYLRLLLPERDVATTVGLLAPLVHAPDLPERIMAAAPPSRPRALPVDESPWPREGRPERARRQPEKATPLEQVVGVILGSPEFQRR